MVYCRYCGTQNKDGTLKCINCGKPLSLMPNDSQKDSIHSSSRDHHSIGNNHGDNSSTHNESINPNISNHHRSPIKDRYMKNDQELNNFENRSNINYESKQSMNQGANGFNNQSYGHRRENQNQNYQNSINSHKETLNDNNGNRGYINNLSENNSQNLDNNLENSNNLNNNINSGYYSQNRPRESVKSNKNSVEWDVIIATALMVIILIAILQRVFPSIAIFISLLIGLIYILIATKSKSTLFKAIPLAILAILAISAYFSI